ncbi:MAG TPA: GNAT family N-acetyltransferase [Anaerolineae bacterium]|nr:GNAT family N-acetyltransferase [Anaerolineae bacterium]
MSGPAVEIVTVDAGNVDRLGFFCYKSKPKSEGYRAKRAWLDGRFAEGLTLHILLADGWARGMMEAAPGEHAWRAVSAAGYEVIHCLWVVGQGKGKGFGSRLLDACESAARSAGRHGVAVVTTHRTWLTGSRFFLRRGYGKVDEAPPCFELLVKRFDGAPLPSFPADWDERARAFGPGLTVVQSGQCPYNAATAEMALEAARQRGIEARVVHLAGAAQARAQSPSAFGTFALVLDGRLLTYHPVGQKELLDVLAAGSEK